MRYSGTVERSFLGSLLMLTIEQEQLKDSILFHNDCANKLESIFDTLRRMAGSPDDIVWKYARIVARDRDEHKQAYRNALDKLFETINVVETAG